MMKVELYLSKGGSAELIGVGFIVLQDLLREDSTGPVKSVIHIMSYKLPNI